MDDWTKWLLGVIGTLGLLIWNSQRERIGRTESRIKDVETDLKEVREGFARKVDLQALEERLEKRFDRIENLLSDSKSK